MIVNRLTQRVLLALACCLVIIFLPLSVGAQTPGGIIKKGAQGIQKGVETGAEKTKEGAEAVGRETKKGAEAVGREVKKAVTGEDTNTSNSRRKGTETNPSTEPSQTTAPPQTNTGETGRKSTESGPAGARGARLPATAGELPLLALIGGLALAASGTSKLIRRVR